jgi:hypothetical protein
MVFSWTEARDEIYNRMLSLVQNKPTCEIARGANFEILMAEFG